MIIKKEYTNYLKYVVYKIIISDSIVLIFFFIYIYLGIETTLSFNQDRPF